MFLFYLHFWNICLLYRILFYIWQLLLFSVCILASIFSWKTAVIFIIISLKIMWFFFLCFYNFVFGFQKFYGKVTQCGILCVNLTWVCNASCICGLMSLISFRKSLVHVSLHIDSVPFCHLIIIPQMHVCEIIILCSICHFYVFNSSFFFLWTSVWMIFTDLSSSSLILSVYMTALWVTHYYSVNYIFFST